MASCLGVQPPPLKKKRDNILHVRDEDDEAAHGRRGARRDRPRGHRDRREKLAVVGVRVLVVEERRLGVEPRARREPRADLEDAEAGQPGGAQPEAPRRRRRSRATRRRRSRRPRGRPPRTSRSCSRARTASPFCSAGLAVSTPSRTFCSRPAGGSTATAPAVARPIVPCQSIYFCFSYWK